MPDGIEFHGTENTTIGLKKATQDALGIVGEGQRHPCRRGRHPAP